MNGPDWFSCLAWIIVSSFPLACTQRNIVSHIEEKDVVLMAVRRSGTAFVSVSFMMQDMNHGAFNYMHVYIHNLSWIYIYIYLHWCHGLIFGRLRVWFWTSFIFKQNGNHEWTMNNISSLRFDSSEPQAEGFRSAICFREFADGSWGGKLETFISFPQVDRGGGIRKLAYKKKSVAVYPDGRGGEPCTKLNLYIYIYTYNYILQ